MDLLVPADSHEHDVSGAARMVRVYDCLEHAGQVVAGCIDKDS